jgi:hypothetical protein
MANVEDLLRKQKDRIEKIGASTPTPRKKIARNGPTRPWQENLPQYQGAESPTLPPADENTLKDRKPTFTEIKSTEFQATETAKAQSPSVSSPGVKITEIKFTETQLTEFKPTEPEATQFESTELRSTQTQSSKTQPIENQSTQIRYTKNQSTVYQATEDKEVGEAPEHMVRTSGYFQLNYSALELMRRLEAGEFVVLQFLTLKAWGWNVDKHRLGSGLVRAAGTYVSQSLGIAKSSADKYLGNLMNKGFLSLVEKSHKRGNTYRVVPLLAASTEKTESRSTETHSTSLPISSQLVDRNSASSSPRNGQLVDRDSVILVDNKSLNIKYLSQADNPESWTQFTAQLTDKARERADRVFQSLKTQFPNDPVTEIAECPQNLKRFGAPDGTPWEKLSSPIGLMESSWPQLREFFRKRHSETAKSSNAREQLEADRKKAAEQDRVETEEWQRRRDAFFAAFPDEQGRREVVHKYLVGLPFKPDSKIGHGIAIGKWWEETQIESERAAIQRKIEQSLQEGATS